MQHAVIVGASLAGVHAAEGLRDRGFSGAITLIDGHPGPVHDRPPLSKGVLAGELSVESVRLRSESWCEDYSVRYLGGVAAESLDTHSSVVYLADGTPIDYDGLVIATGLTPRRPDCFPHAAPGAHLLRTEQDALALREDLLQARSVAVVGGGFLGLEVAATARSMGLAVTVIEAESTLLGRVLPPAIGGWFADLHRRNGVDIRLGSRVEKVVATRPGFDVTFVDGSSHAFDVLVIAVGAQPVVDWLAGSTVAVDDGVLCNADLSTSVPGVVAAGDLARWPHPRREGTIRLEHWTNAVEQGRHAAGTLLGQSVPFESIPYFWTDQFDAKARSVGWLDADQELAVIERSETKLVIALGNGSGVTGAVCVNAPKELVRLRRAIDTQTPWSDVVGIESAQSKLSASQLSRA